MFIHFFFSEFCLTHIQVVSGVVDMKVQRFFLIYFLLLAALVYSRQQYSSLYGTFRFLILVSYSEVQMVERRSKTCWRIQSHIKPRELTVLWQLQVLPLPPHGLCNMRKSLQLKHRNTPAAGFLRKAAVSGDRDSFSLLLR